MPPLVVQAAIGSEAQSSHGGGEQNRPKPASSGSTLWTFVVVQQAAPKQ